MSWLVSNLPGSFRSPGEGLFGWLAMKSMSVGNSPSTEAAIIERLDLQSDHTFVELGAGNGAGLKSLLLLKEKSGVLPKRIVCGEISPAFRRELEAVKAEMPFSDRIEIFPEDCIQLPILEDKSVDRIFGMNVVYFLNPLEEYLQEFHRVLKPHGILVFGCKFTAIPKDKPDIFANVQKDVIIEKMKAQGFETSSMYVDAGTGNKMHNFVEIKGVKKSI